MFLTWNGTGDDESGVATCVPGAVVAVGWGGGTTAGAGGTVPQLANTHTLIRTIKLNLHSPNAMILQSVSKCVRKTINCSR